MVVPKMTFEEIQNEIYKEISSVIAKVLRFIDDYKKVVLKTSKFPLIKYYTFTTKNKNTYIAQYIYKKRGKWDDPRFSVHCIFPKAEGNYLIGLDLYSRSITIYPPHFFRRYRERIVKDFDMSNDDLIKIFISNTKGSISTAITEDFKAIPLNTENGVLENDEIYNLVHVNEQGFCFGEYIGRNKIIKTMVSEEMLFDNQKELFKNMKIELYLQNFRRHGIEFRE